jgi:hypothetical protein
LPAERCIRASEALSNDTGGERSEPPAFFLNVFPVSGSPAEPANPNGKKLL